MYRHKTGPRWEHKDKEGQRVKASPSLAERYQKLKSMTVNLAYCAPESDNPPRQVTYTMNLSNAKSVVRFDCPNEECIRGDFELTKELAAAIAKRRKLVEGELCCTGWRSKAAIRRTKCSHVLRYKLMLTY